MQNLVHIELAKTFTQGSAGVAQELGLFAPVWIRAPNISLMGCWPTCVGLFLKDMVSAKPREKADDYKSWTLNAGNGEGTRDYSADSCLEDSPLSPSLVDPVSIKRDYQPHVRLCHFLLGDTWSSRECSSHCSSSSGFSSISRENRSEMITRE